MEQCPEMKKHSCTLCKKRFTSARILENHKKTHFPASSSRQEPSQCNFSDHDLKKDTKKSQKSPSFSKCKACGKRSDSSRSLSGQWGKVKKKNWLHCKECVKGFQYERPLSNPHKRRHLVNPRITDEPKTSSSFSVVRRKRSRTIRYKKNNTSISFDNLPKSFSVSESEKEVEVAECLIMLSRGMNCLDGFLRNKQKNLELGVSIDETYRESFSAFGGDHSFKMEKLKEKLDSGFSSDSSGYLSEKETSESCKFDDALHDSGMEMEIHLGNKTVHDGVESTDTSIKEDGFEVAGDAELVSASSDSEMLMETQKKGEHRCRICDKVFPSHQALGGHQTVHRTTKSFVKLKAEECKEALQPDIVPEAKTECKLVEFKDVNSSMEHKCSICLRVFASGQALGGHRKAHHKKTSKTGFGQNPIDLNFPAVID